MSLQQLFDHLDDLIRTPEDVARLEAAILDLAVRGKLVPQEEGDEPAEELVSGWKHYQLDQLLSGIEAGKSYAAESRPAEAGEYGVLKVSAVTWGQFQPNENKALPPGTEVRPQYQVRKGDVLISRANTAELVGAVVLVDQDYPHLQLSDKTLRLVFSAENVFLPFMVLALRSKPVRSYFAANASGTSASMRNLSQDKIRGAPILLPPLAEQRRIVAKVDELLAQTRALAANLRRAQEEIVVVNQAALHRLETAGDGESLQAAWHTVAGSFDLLYADPRPLAGLRQAILQLAVRGKLVPQEEGDEAALPSPSGATVPCSLPTTWQWAEIDAVCSHVVDCPHSTAKFINEGHFYCIDTTCIDQGVILFDKLRRVSESTFNERIRRLRPEAGDILFSREGSIGLTIIVPEGMNVCLGQRMMLFRPSDLVTSQYLRYAIISDVFVRQWHTQRTGTAAQHVNVGALRRALVPLPPLAEQRRIVAKVDELMAMCDALERRLVQAEEVRRAAVESVLAHI